MKRVEICLVPWLLLAGCSSVQKPNSAETDSQLSQAVCPACGALFTNTADHKVSAAPVRCPKCGELLWEPPRPPAPTTKRAYAQTDVQTNGRPVRAVAPDELEHARNQIVFVHSDMPVKKVLATLGLSRFRGHATKCEGPTDVVFRFELASDHILDMRYERQAAPAPAGRELRWLSVDETYWYPARSERSEAPYFSVDVEGYPRSKPPPVTEKELAFAAGHMTLLRPDMKVRHVLETLGLERFRGHFMFGSGSISLSVHGELGDGHKLDMIYDYGVRPARPWELSWVGLDWHDSQTGLGHWDAPGRNKK